MTSMEKYIQTIISSTEPMARTRGGAGLMNWPEPKEPRISAMDWERTMQNEVARGGLHSVAKLRLSSGVIHHIRRVYVKMSVMAMREPGTLINVKYS